jgi:hypothetical protein
VTKVCESIKAEYQALIQLLEQKRDLECDSVRTLLQEEAKAGARSEQQCRDSKLLLEKLGFVIKMLEEAKLSTVDIKSLLDQINEAEKQGEVPASRPQRRVAVSKVSESQRKKFKELVSQLAVANPVSGEKSDLTPPRSRSELLGLDLSALRQHRLSTEYSTEMATGRSALGVARVSKRVGVVRSARDQH